MSPIFIVLSIISKVILSIVVVSKLMGYNLKFVWAYF